MRARRRDVIVLAVFAAGAVLVRLAWHPLGPWVSLGIAFLSALVAVAVYRIAPPRARPNRPPLRLRD